MALFKKILYPTDFSDSSINLLSYVLELSRLNNAELIILYAYRLNDPAEDQKSIILLKKEIEKRAQDSFGKIENDFLNPSKINYTLLTEIGFMNDRINSTVETQHVDLLVLSRELKSYLKTTDQSKSDEILPDLTCPILILPPCKRLT